MSKKRKLISDALRGTTALGLRLQQSRALRELPKARRQELAFHLSEMVVDVARFLDSTNVGPAWEQLCSDLVFHWPHHDKPARRLLSRR